MRNAARGVPWSPRKHGLTATTQTRSEYVARKKAQSGGRAARFRRRGADRTTSGALQLAKGKKARADGAKARREAGAPRASSDKINRGEAKNGSSGAHGRPSVTTPLSGRPPSAR
jgi:hypothetical protein